MARIVVLGAGIAGHTATAYLQKSLVLNKVNSLMQCVFSITGFRKIDLFYKYAG